MKPRLPLFLLVASGFACGQGEPFGPQREVRNTPLSAKVPPGIPPTGGGPTELGLVKSAFPATGSVAADDTIAFDIRLTNMGPGIAVRAWLTDALPDLGTSWTVAYTGGVPVHCEFIGTTMACGQFVASSGGTGFVGITLTPKQFYSLRVSAVTDKEDCGIVTNTATAVANRSPQVSDSASITVICEAELEVVKSGFPDDRTLSPGDPFWFDVTVTNSGSATVSKAFLLDQLPDFASSWTVEQIAGDVDVICERSGTRVACGIFNPNDPTPEPDLEGVDLAPGQSYTVRFTAANDLGDCGTVTNTASAVADNARTVSDSGSVVVICPPLP